MSLLLFSLLFGWLAVPVAYLLLWQVRRAAVERRTGEPPWPSGWVVPVCVVVSQMPLVIGLKALFSAHAGGGPDREFWTDVVPLLFGPAAMACWAAWVVTRAGKRWLSITALSVLAGVPLLVETAALVIASPDFSDRSSLFHGLPTLLTCEVGPLVTAVSLALFSVGGLVIAGVIGGKRAVKS